MGRAAGAFRAGQVWLTFTVASEREQLRPRKIFSSGNMRERGGGGGEGVVGRLERERMGEVIKKQQKIAAQE